MENLSSSGLSGVELTRAAYDYGADAAQRSVLFMDVLRKRGNLYFQHLKARQPPVLTFDYELILEGRTLKRPVNYSLVRILNRRHPPLERQDVSVERRNNPVFRKGYPLERRRCPIERRGNNGMQAPQNPDQKNRPIVIIDPRAGHGPGIGGSKRDSEVGMALNNGHPVYFVIFYTDPIPGQTIADIQKAQVRFIEEVVLRHPQAPEPAVIGNCQAGWAVALVGADRPDVTGPLIFNGSPLSYWAGVEGKNPMRYRGGLLGGVWLTSFASDLGNGKFDGANLVAGFEDLNPANTLWTKQYNLYAKVDTEETRFLNFERWWSGYYLMASEEIHFIVDSLFIGNHLEKGNLELEKNPKREVRESDQNLRNMEKGGFVAGLVRIILALAVADKSLDRDELAAAEDIVLNYQPSKKIKRADYIQMVKEQSRILQTDLGQAIGTLPKLIKTSKDRQRAMTAAQQIVFADKDLNPKEEAIWARISKALKVKP